MPAVTPRRDYPYPLDTDLIDVAADIRRLAMALDADVVGNPPIQTNDDQNQLIVGNSGGSSNPLVLIGPSNNCWMSFYTGPMSGSRAGLIGYPNSPNLNVRNERTDGDLVLQAQDGPVHVFAEKGNPAIELRSASGPIELTATNGTIHAVAAGGGDIVMEAGDVISLQANGKFEGISETGDAHLISNNEGLLCEAQKNATFRSVNGDILLDAQGTGAIMRFVADTEGMRLTPTVLFVGKTASDYSGNDGVELFRSGRVLISSNTAEDTVRVTKFGAAVVNDAPFLTFYTGTNLQGSIKLQSDGSGIEVTGTSDRRLKDVVGPIPDPVERLQELRPLTYAWKNTGRHAEGFLADEVQRVVPGAVSGEPDAVDPEGKIVPQQLSVTALIPLLTAALQSAFARIETLEAR